MIKGMIVHDPRSIVLVDNISRGPVSLPRDGQPDKIVLPGKTTQLTWAEFVHFKSLPGFGHRLKLNDSVIISEGQVKIKNIGTSLNDDVMIGILVQSTTIIKETILTFNEADREIFRNFLETRKSLDIEAEKCEELIGFIDRNFVSEAVAEEVEEEIVAEESTKKPKGRPKKTVEKEETQVETSE
jgi:hypothetical protein